MRFLFRFTLLLIGSLSCVWASLEQKREKDPFGLKIPLHTYDLVANTGEFTPPPKDLQKKTDEYIESITKGQLDINSWNTYVTPEDLTKAQAFFKDNFAYVKEYLKEDFSIFVQNREKVDSYFFTVERLSFVKVLLPFFQKMAYYKNTDDLTNAIGMYYLGRSCELLSEVFKDKEKIDAQDQALRWYVLSYIMARVAESENPAYASNTGHFESCKTNEELRKAIIEHKKDPSKTFYNNPWNRLNGLKNPNVQEVLGELKETLKYIDDEENKRVDNFKKGNSLSPGICPRSIFLDRLPDIFMDMKLTENKIQFLVFTKIYNLAIKFNDEEYITAFGARRRIIHLVTAYALSTLNQFQEASDFLTPVQNTLQGVIVKAAIQKLKQPDDMNDKKILRLIKNQKPLTQEVRFATTIFYKGGYELFLKNRCLSIEKRLEGGIRFFNKMLFYNPTDYCPREHLNALLLAMRYYKLVTSHEVFRLLSKDSLKTFESSLDKGLPPQIINAEYLDAVKTAIEETFPSKKISPENEMLNKPVQKDTEKGVKQDSSSNKVPETLIEIPKGENLTQYKQYKDEKKAEEPGEKLRSRLQKIFELSAELKSMTQRTNMPLINIREDLEEQKNLTSLEKEFLEFTQDQNLSNNFIAVINDMRYYGYELKGKGQPEKIGGTDYYTRRIGKAARIVYTVDKDGIIICGLFKDHDAYIKFINKR